MKPRRYWRHFAIYAAPILVGMMGLFGTIWGMQPNQEGVLVEGIEVLKFQGHEVVRVTSSQPPDYSSFPLREPLGIMLQLPGATVEDVKDVIRVDQDSIAEIRTTHDVEADRPMVEIQILLKEPTAYRLVSEGPYLFVHLEGPEEPLSSPDMLGAQEPQGTSEMTVAEVPTTEKETEVEGETPPRVSPFEAAPAEHLVDLLIEQQTDGTRIALVGDGEISKYKGFAIEDPNRIVVDIWDVSHTIEVKKKDTRSQELAGVRVGIHPDKVRFVFDLVERTGDFPPYSLERDQDKLVLCLGEMAEGGKGPAPDEMMKSEAQDAQGKEPEDAQILAVDEASHTDLARSDSTPEKADSEENDTIQIALADEVTEEVPSQTEPIAETSEEVPPGVEQSELSTQSATAETIPPDDTPEQTLEAVEDANKGLSLEEEGIQEVVLEEIAVDQLTEPEASFSEETLAQMDPPSGGNTIEDMTIDVEEVVSLAQFSPEIEEEEVIGFEINTGMTPGEVYMGERINLDFQDIDIENVFRLLAEVSDLNIIVSEKVSGKVSMRVKNIPWDQALDLILSTYKLGSVTEGNVVRVAPLEELRKEEEQRRQLAADKRKEKADVIQAQKDREKLRRELVDLMRDFVEKRIRINYANASDIESQITPLLTDRKVGDVVRKGSTIVDERTNTLTISDFPETIAKIEEYIDSVDLPTPQVLMEARIVEANSTFARNLGVQWGVNSNWRRGDWGYGAGEDVLSNSWTSRTGDENADFLSGTHIPQTLVNLPAAAAFGVNPAAAGLSIGRIAGDLLNLDLRLTAAEQEGITKIISRPKVMTMDNVEAVIAQGREIPYTQVNPEGNVSVVWKEALLRVTVTPRISPDERVHLKLNITNDDIDPSIRSSQGEPAITKQEATTEVLVHNGETVVIGGIFKETSSEEEGGVPGLKDLPALSWLFKTTAKSQEKRELLIFMTPYIVTLEI